MDATAPEQEEEDDWFGRGGFDFDDDDQEPSDYVATHDDDIQIYDSLFDIMTRIGKAEEGLGPCQDYTERTKLVESHMGSMALCRGQPGEELRDAGAICAILNTLGELVEKLPPSTTHLTHYQQVATKLAVVCLGAVRDLSCGSTGNREALREIESVGLGGMQLLSIYLERYRGIHWHELDPLQLNLLTTVVGAMRNVTHSTAPNCIQLHAYGVSEMLIWRLKHAASNSGAMVSLPDASSPWREGAFRSASTLINMAEKCSATAEKCGKDPVIIRLLVESGGGSQQNFSLLHIGLAAILRSAKDQLEPDIYDESWDQILFNEKRRKLVAQKREVERKELAATSI